jgi:hypothetical protein
VAELLSRDSERVMRSLIALMVLRCDPLAVALTAAASAGQSTTVQEPHWSAVPEIAAVLRRFEGSQQVRANNEMAALRLHLVRTANR